MVRVVPWTEQAGYSLYIRTRVNTTATPSLGCDEVMNNHPPMQSAAGNCKEMSSRPAPCAQPCPTPSLRMSHMPILSNSAAHDASLQCMLMQPPPHSALIAAMSASVCSGLPTLMRMYPDSSLFA